MLEIELENRIVIFDEAHNVLEATNDIHTCEVKTETIEVFWEALDRYY